MHDGDGAADRGREAGVRRLLTTSSTTADATTNTAGFFAPGFTAEYGMNVILTDKLRLANRSGESLTRHYEGRQSPMS